MPRSMNRRGRHRGHRRRRASRNALSTAIVCRPDHADARGVRISRDVQRDWSGPNASPAHPEDRLPLLPNELWVEVGVAAGSFHLQAVLWLHRNARSAVAEGFDGLAVQ